MKNNISISLNEELLRKIDQEKGLAARSTYINYLLHKALEAEDAK
jgi:metal-responsive CopG/Arc/MetJ family transcriptional regulator